MWKRLRISFLLTATQEGDALVRGGDLGWIGEFGSKPKGLIKVVHRGFIIAFVAISAAQQKQRAGSLFSIAGGLIEFLSLVQQRYCFICVTLLLIQAAKRSHSPRLRATSLVALGEIECLLKVPAGIFEFSARQKHVAEFYQPIGCEVLYSVLLG